MSSESPASVTTGLDQIIYLDNGATSFPKPGEVYDATDRFFRSCGVNPGRSGYDLALKAGAMVEESRRLLTRMFHGTDPNRLCFSSNSTDALNLILFGLLQHGDHAISTTLEHNSVLRPLHHLALHHGVDMEHVPCDRRGFVDPDDISRRFKKNTRLVVVNHASNVIGTIQPIREIGSRCRARGVLLVVDASQTAGKVPVDVEQQRIDVVAFTGHKGLLGPTGIGGLYVREGVHIRHTRAGGTGVRSAQRTHLDEYPYRLEYGTLNAHGIAGLRAGIEWIEANGMAAIHEREMRLIARLRDGIAKIPGVVLYCQEDLSDHIAVLSFNVVGLDSQHAAMMLDVDHGIACRAGLHCAPLVHEHLGTDKMGGTVRMSLGPFNTEAHIDVAIRAIADIAADSHAVVAAR